MNDLIAQIIGEAEALDIPLAEAPAASAGGHPCPGCGGTNAAPGEPGSTSVTCNDCGSMYVPIAESKAKELLRKFSESRARRVRTLNHYEALNSIAYNARR